MQFLKRQTIISPKQLGYITLLSLLSILSFWRILFFDFYQDDWFVLWSSLYNIRYTYGYFNHPGTPLQLLIFSHIFGLHPVLWELFGLGLKVIDAYLVGIFLYKLTRSKSASFLASIFFAVAYAGMDTLNTPLMNIPGIVVIPILLTLIYFIKAMQEDKRHIRAVILFLVLALGLDPARALPVLFILPFLLLFFSKSKETIYVRQFFAKLLLFAVVIGTPLLVLWFTHFASGTELAIALKGLYQDPAHTLQKLKYAGNFFATAANVFTEPIYGLQHNNPYFADYRRPFGILGILILFAAVISFILFLRRKSSAFGYMSVFILWVYVFYLPNWFAEPRRPITAENHYLFISSIGVVCLLAYLISLVHKRWLVVFLSLCFIILNAYRANILLAWQFPYRSAAVNERIWQAVSQTVPRNEKNDAFFFTGQQPWLESSIRLYGAIRFLLLRKDSNLAQAPLLTLDENLIVARICSAQDTTPNKNAGLYNPVPLSHIYAWEVKAPGELVNRTSQERKKLEKIAQERNCHAIE